jgi:hypothetical protein
MWLLRQLCDDGAQRNVFPGGVGAIVLLPDGAKGFVPSKGALWISRLRS